MKNILIDILGVNPVSATQPCRRLNPRQGVSTIETSLLIAMILGSLILLFGAVKGNVTQIVKSMDNVLIVGERVVGEGEPAESTPSGPVDASIESDTEETGSNLMVGLGVPTAALAIVVGVAYLVVKI